MPMRVAKIAVSAATYSIDRPFDYLIPEELSDSVLVGTRVMVPFGRGNRRSEGIVIGFAEDSEWDNLKSVERVLDERPVLDEEQLKLAFFIRDRFFCTVYEAVKIMLPAGLWFTDEGKRRVNDKTLEMVKLAMLPEDAAEIAENKSLRAPQQAKLIEMLCAFEALPSRELLSFTGASRQSLNALKRAGIVEYYEREVYRRPELHVGEPEPLPTLSDEQRTAFLGLDRLAAENKPGAALLLGVTGSGKTSVYIHLIASCLRRGKTAMLLVPEIALTPQMLRTFSSHFGDDVAVMHSSLSIGERYDEWKRVKNGKARVVIGTRSAIFAPLKSLGIIIIDEEQEETYKSENCPRYDARDVAKYRCAQNNCLLLLGSATPDICSRYYAETGKYSLFRLDSRYNDMQLPSVRIVDMKNELRSGNESDISGYLREELRENIERGEQSILFINRRGAHKLLSCGACGYTYKCPRCSVSLTYHSANERLMCHYCGYIQRRDEHCPECGGDLYFVGSGTQNIEKQLKELFPETEVLRVDTDTVAPAGSHEKLFERFRKENIPIMVGTQMVTKGLNFPNVTLVGVISADQSLYAGDYRAGERTFSLITQVVGRSGRGDKPGRAVIQTFTPENETIRHAAEQDYESFFRSEIELRQLQNAPPFKDILSLTVTGMLEEEVRQCCAYLSRWLHNVCSDKPEISILGPAPLPVVRVNNRYRYRINICCRSNGWIRRVLSEMVISCSSDKKFKGVSVFADNSPVE